MLKFTIAGGKVLLDPNLVLFQEFSDILSYGEKQKDKDLANRMLLYIYWCCDLSQENPMSGLDHRLKEGQALSRALGKHKKSSFNKKETALIDAGMDAYNFFNETALERVGLSYDKKIDELRTQFDGLKLEIHEIHDENGGVKGFASNDKIIENVGKQIVEMANNKLKAMEAARKIENKGRVRGDKGSSMIERGVFRNDED